jgi:hypothetical protein
MEDVLAGSSCRVACALLMQRCTHAVRTGAPLYNQGKVLQCVELYERTIHVCMQHAGMAPAPVIEMLHEALLESAENSQSASRRAWALRRGLDRAIHAAVEMGSSSRSPSPPTPPAAKAPAVAAMGWTSARANGSSSTAPPTETCHLFALPDDLMASIVAHLYGRTIGGLALTCSVLYDRVASHAAAVVSASRHELASIVGAQARPAPLWLRAHAATSELETRIGPRHATRPWWAEYVPLMTAESASHEQTVDVRTYMRGGHHSLSALLRRHARSLAWMVDAGWPPSHAAPVMVLCSCAAAAIGGAIRQRSPAYTASVHAVCEALRARAHAVSTAAPLTYAAIDGRYGLAAADPAWLALTSLHALPGTSIVTSSPLLASVHATQLPDPACSGPTQRLASAALGSLDAGSCLVVFVSEARRSVGDALRSLLQIAPEAYALPPHTTVTLLASFPPGAWCKQAQRRCLCVSTHALF